MRKDVYTAIVLAAGRGTRMKSSVQKQFLMLDEKPVIYYALKCFQDSPYIRDIILVTGEDSLAYCKKEIVEKFGFTKVTKVEAGGKERYDSVYAGLCACDNPDYVLIHDGARPFITEEMVERTCLAVKKTGACVVGMPVKDTIKISNGENMVESTPDRARVWMVQTPQAFGYSLIKASYEAIRSRDMRGITDDAMIVEQESGAKVSLVPGSYENIKITTPEDFVIAEAFLRHETAENKGKK